MGRRKLTTEGFIKRASEIHGDHYDYSKVTYERSKNKVLIICPDHGTFEQEANSHLLGRGCTECGRSKTVDSRLLSTTLFINKAKEVHGDKYDYSEVEYVRGVDKIEINCTKHGAFSQRGAAHIRGSGCPECDLESRPGVINQTILDRDHELASRDYYLYYVKLINRCSRKEYWKIGIESKLKSRWKTNKNYEVEYLFSLESTLGYCFNLEQKLMKQYDTGVCHIDWPYTGRTEMLPYDFLNIVGEDDESQK